MSTDDPERRSARALQPASADETKDKVLPQGVPRRRGKGGSEGQPELGLDLLLPQPGADIQSRNSRGEAFGPPDELVPIDQTLLESRTADNRRLPSEPGETESIESQEPAKFPVHDPVPADPIPVRMLNEFVYCQRLFYYEYVDGVFVESADTARGSAIHEKVDRGRGDLPAAKKPRKPRNDGADEPALPDSTESDSSRLSPASLDASVEAQPADPAEPDSIPQDQTNNVKTDTGETIHSRSASMGSDRIGVVAKMDLIEVVLEPRTQVSGSGLWEPTSAPIVQRVTPVDYKAGAPRKGVESNELWDADKMQLGLQILILRDNGYVCEEGVIYYRATKQRVRLTMTPDLEVWIMERIAEARRVAAAPVIPPPLVNSPKCVRCSLAPVCLPDETRLLARRIGGPALVHTPRDSSLLNVESEAPVSRPAAQTPPGAVMVPRRLIAARDEERALYLNTQGHRVGIKSEVLVIKDGDRVVEEIRMMDVSHVALFGNIQMSTQAVQELCEQEIPVALFSMGGWFYGLTRGHGLKNVFTRIRQFAVATDPAQCLALAKKIVQAKIKNHRTLMMRLHVEAPSEAVVGLREIASRTLDATTLGELLGMEGAAAALYFRHFAGMIKVGGDDPDDELPGLETPAAKREAKRQAAAEEFTFDFTKRTRRPPTDAVNALLSLAYSLLAKDCTLAALAVGFDPYVGFYHQPRHGRPALALDLMEEFRPLIAESAVLTAINNRMVNGGHFVRAGEAVNLSPTGRKAFFHAYEQRMNALITHPVFDYKVSYRRVIELQARLLARCLTGEIPEYVPMLTR